MKKLSSVSVLGYGAADTANSMTISTANLFLLLYYTDVAGIGAAAAGTLLLVVRIFHAFADIAAGRIVDHSFSRRWGKFRPFLLFGFVPLVLMAAAFNVPDIGETSKLIYAYVTYAAFSMGYSLVNIPYGCLIGAMTQNPRDRARLAGARTIGGLLCSSALGIFVAPLMVPGNDLQRIFTVLTVIFVVAGSGLYFFTAAVTRERVQRDVVKISLAQSMTALRGNKPLLVLCTSSVLFNTGAVALNTSQIFYLRDVLDLLYLYPAVAAGHVAMTLTLAVAAPRLVHRWGKRNMYFSGGILGIAGGLAVFLAPTAAPIVGVIGIFVCLIGSALVNILVWALVADTVEFGQWNTGVRAEGVNYSVLSSTRKLGMGLGGALAAFALAAGSYAPDAVEQSQSAMLGIRAAAGLFPAVLILAAVAVMFWYRLTDKRHAELIVEIERSRSLD
ncbi:glycoside-pentoside-hexuronide (GPH):cation symporter [Arthrobacter castelli]|uniref:glycoside-pentoside-hexuronide (GPH):cation symporter n=1 Tax=Arthrobacter castelli TaxID=271431 RepID=UPI0003FBD436|nr:glycoside-pentoside-hexuronide (GPH):cation symporter [Arthrobacter castelli]